MVKSRLSDDRKRRIVATILRDYEYNAISGVVTKNGEEVAESLHVSSRRKYRRICVGSDKVLTHNVVWILVYGSFPEHEIDHDNGDPSDNRVCNLKDVPHGVNQKNKRRIKQRDLPPGITARTLKSGSIRYRAQIGVDGRCVHSPHRDTLEEAINDRLDALMLNGYSSGHVQDFRKHALAE